MNMRKFKDTGTGFLFDPNAEPDQETGKKPSSKPDRPRIHSPEQPAWEEVGRHSPVTSEEAAALRRALDQMSTSKPRPQRKRKSE